MRPGIHGQTCCAANRPAPAPVADRISASAPAKRYTIRAWLSSGFRFHRPITDARINAIYRNILLHHQPGFAPTTIERIGISKVLAHLGSVIPAAQRIPKRTPMRLVCQPGTSARPESLAGMASRQSSRMATASRLRPAAISASASDSAVPGAVVAEPWHRHRWWRRTEPPGLQIGIRQQRDRTVRADFRKPVLRPTIRLVRHCPSDRACQACCANLSGLCFAPTLTL